VRDRAHNRCEYCQHPAGFSCAPYVCEHVVPRVLGAGDTLAELAWACPACNGHKSDKTHAYDPKTKRLVSLFNPRRQKWSAHFTWSADARLLIGHTATGRATVEALQLNREELRNLRGTLSLLGQHPPYSDDQS
jgi:hypothetical protein